MRTIQEEILDEFFARLGKSSAFAQVDVGHLRRLLSGSGKPKPADLLLALSAPSNPPAGGPHDPD